MFKNEALLDFGIAQNRENTQKALNELDTKIKSATLIAHPIVAGKTLKGEEIYQRFDPCNKEVLLGQTSFASISQTEQALDALTLAFPKWSNTPYTERAAILKRAAAIMQQRKFEISALITREAGKPWAEADGETAEAIDFCSYYADEILRLGPTQKMGSAPGEENTYFYQARGVGVVISPWNFPFAISCGMTVAGLVTGNTVALKPSEQTSLCAALLVEILYQAGIPKEALAFLPGKGELIGAHMVASPKVDFICFTGSKGVGLEIIHKASKVIPTQRNVKRVVAEMGGKNAIIIDEDADPDEAIKGVLASTFGYAGQKCSACSRLIIVGALYEQILARLKHAAADIIVGAACESASFLPAVIDQETQERLLKSILEAEKESTLLFKGQVPNSGYFVPATIFRDVKTSSKLWREELFGPVLACTKAADFTEALELANDSEYALTGGVYSRSPKNLDRARLEFKVGNLYINRKITGALVYRQPFGGFKMSGIGSKAGGPDYLIQFMEPRTISENTMRRGFAPEN